MGTSDERAATTPKFPMTHSPECTKKFITYPFRLKLGAVPGTVVVASEALAILEFGGQTLGLNGDSSGQSRGTDWGVAHLYSFGGRRFHGFWSGLFDRFGGSLFHGFWSGLLDRLRSRLFHGFGRRLFHRLGSRFFYRLGGGLPRWFRCGFLHRWFWCGFFYGWLGGCLLHGFGSRNLNRLRGGLFHQRLRGRLFHGRRLFHGGRFCFGSARILLDFADVVDAFVVGDCAWGGDDGSA